MSFGRRILFNLCHMMLTPLLDTLKVDSDSTEDIDSGMMDRKYLRTLRAFYVTSSRMPPPAPVGYMTTKTFLPARLGRREFETMSQTMYRIEAWLKVTGKMPDGCVSDNIENIERLHLELE